MQSHDDKSHEGFARMEMSEKTRLMMEMLKEKAEGMRELKESQITSGYDNEAPLSTWEYGRLTCQRFPPDPSDPQGMTRISLGGMDTEEVKTEYLVVRGDRKHIIRLLRASIEAIKQENIGE